MNMYRWIVRLEIIVGSALIAIIGGTVGFPFIPQTNPVVLLVLAIILFILFFIGGLVAPDEEQHFNRRSKIPLVEFTRFNGVIFSLLGLWGIGIGLLACSLNSGWRCLLDNNFGSGLLLLAFGAFLLVISSRNAQR